MSDDNNNDNALPGDNLDGGASANQKTLKDVLSTTLGKEFKDDDTALKAVKDTFSYVSGASKAKKALEAVMQSKSMTEEQAIAFIEQSATKQENQVDTSKYVSREDFERANFYNERVELKPYQSLIETFAKANPGKSRDEILAIPEIKTVLDKVKSHDTTERQKSVLHSNPRIGMSTDKLTKAREELSKGDAKGAGDSAVGAVIDAFEI